MQKNESESGLVYPERPIDSSAIYALSTLATPLWTDAAGQKTKHADRSDQHAWLNNPQLSRSGADLLRRQTGVQGIGAADRRLSQHLALHGRQRVLGSKYAFDV